MRRKNERTYAIISGILMLTVILDGKTALENAIVGIDLCLRTVVPSLFPFFILSGILNSSLLGQNIRFVRPIGRLCKIPSGSESILLLGLLAGYPVGAQLIGNAYRDGNLSRKSAARMVAFCNNAGPAFIFGILSTMFSSRSTAWILWIIQIASAIFVGALLPSYSSETCVLMKDSKLSITGAMNKTVKTMASVCGWVIIFRVLLGFCEKWFIWRLPITVQVLISGLLELSNGCVRLQEVSSEGIRFVLASILLSAGGLCVTMQTLSVGEGVITHTYFLGKGVQILIATALSAVVQVVLFSGSDHERLPFGVMIALIFAIIFSIFLIFRKKM